MELKEIISELKKPFPVEDHKERTLPGGGKWFFIPWQSIRDRLDEVYPAWQCFYSEPAYLGEYCHIICTISIEGVSRSAPGNAPIEVLSGKGKDMSRGTPIERAIADAFKNSAEAWGIGRYLDNQEFVVRYLKSKGDMRGEKRYIENKQIEAGARGLPSKPITSILDTEPNKPTGKKITEAQAKRLWAIAKGKGLSNDDVKNVFVEYAIASTAEIPISQYDEIVSKIEHYNSF
jgi:hypothetical protein